MYGLLLLLLLGCMNKKKKMVSLNDRTMDTRFIITVEQATSAHSLKPE